MLPSNRTHLQIYDRVFQLHRAVILATLNQDTKICRDMPESVGPLLYHGLVLSSSVLWRAH